MTRYAKKMVRPEFYGKVVVADVTSSKLTLTINTIRKSPTSVGFFRCINTYIREIISNPGDGCRGYCNLQLKV